MDKSTEAKRQPLGRKWMKNNNKKTHMIGIPLVLKTKKEAFSKCIKTLPHIFPWTHAETRMTKAHVPFCEIGLLYCYQSILQHIHSHEAGPVSKAWTVWKSQHDKDTYKTMSNYILI